MSKANLVVMSGPDDGAIFELNDTKVLIGDSPECQVVIHYDPQLPPDGVEMRIQGNSLIFKDKANGKEGIGKFGELYQVGQTWIAVYRSQEEGGGERDKK